MSPNSDPEVMVLVPHTPREDAYLRNYESWLAEVDNPFFNALPGVVHYANWRICAPNPAVPFTHVDFLRIESEEAAGELADNAEMIEFGLEWTRLWGRYPDTEVDDPRLNGYLYLCRRLGGYRIKSHYLAFQPTTERPELDDVSEVWEVVMPLTGDVRFPYVRVVPLDLSEDFPATEVAVPSGCFGSALAELIAAPDADEILGGEEAGQAVNGPDATERPGSRTATAAIGSSRVVVWAIKHLVSPLDRLIVKFGRGRIPPLSSFAVPTLLMTTIGRRSGLERTTPLVFLRDGDDYIVANARPSHERRNPWVSNLRAAGAAQVQERGRTTQVTARELETADVEQWWPKLVKTWPAFADHYANTGERTEDDESGGGVDRYYCNECANDCDIDGAAGQCLFTLCCRCALSPERGGLKIRCERVRFSCHHHTVGSL